ncbi:MAG: hypothetical protein JWR19_2352 [Pedosphaera sp.]|nr:hypothetical protein [Pedosphaera sp.]
MLKAKAWPYPVFENVSFGTPQAKFGDIDLKMDLTSKGWVITGGQLKDRSSGIISLSFQIKTPSSEVAEAVFGAPDKTAISCGARLLCKESKFRKFFPADNHQSVKLEIPLERLRGVAEIVPMFVSANQASSANGIIIQQGSVLGLTAKPIFLTIDEDWTGEAIPVDWLGFAENNLPAESLMHIEISGGSQVPKVWLNLKYKSKLEHVLLRKGDSSPAGLAGAAMREFFWVHVWEKVLIWALKEASAENEDWPATRIADYWRSKFNENGFEMPVTDQLDADALNELSSKIQHCLCSAQKLSQINNILRFQPDSPSLL